MKTRVFLNPAAGRGQAARSWPQLSGKLQQRLGDFEVATSNGPGHLTELARLAAGQGVQRFIAVGGDGSVNETLNGMLDPQGRLLVPDSVLCPIPAGTANELSRALGHLARPDAAFDAALCRSRRRLDLTVSRCRALAGEDEIVRYGYLVTSFGSAAQISHDTSRSRLLKRLGGRFSYFLVTLIVTLTFRHRTVRIAIDGETASERKLLTGLCCNVENAGGGMKLAPGAEPDDGRLDYVEFGDIARHDILLRPPSWLFEGRHIEHPEVRRHSGRRFDVSCAVETLVDVDGETVGRLPLRVELIPSGFAVGV